MDDKVSLNAVLGGLLILGAIIFLNLEKKLTSLKQGTERLLKESEKAEAS